MTAEPESLAVLEESLLQLNMIAMMNYASTLLALKGDDDKRVDAFSAVMQFCVNVMAQTICSREPVDKTLEVTLGHLPELLRTGVESYQRRVSEAVAFIERDGAPLQ